MGILGFIILGLLAGIIAKAIMPGRDGGGFIVTTILGVVGALLGGWIGSLITGVNPVDHFFDLSTWVAAILGSLVVLFIYNMVTRRGTSRAL